MNIAGLSFSTEEIRERGTVTEWLETDGLGGFASGTISGVRTRRYHALLLAATLPPAGRMVLVNGLDAWIETPDGTIPLSTQHYLPDAYAPAGRERIERFDSEPWPTWTYALSDQLQIRQEFYIPRGMPAIALRWSLTGTAPKGWRLRVKLFFSGRDFHSLHHRNDAFAFDPARENDETLIWHPYRGVPGVIVRANGAFEGGHEWYRQFAYEEERARGLDFFEDLAAPGIWTWDLDQTPEAVCLLAAEGAREDGFEMEGAVLNYEARLRAAEVARRAGFATVLDRAADDYLVKRGKGHTIIAGYPWFGDWGRDTFVAIRGICLATGRLAEAGSILVEWSEAVSEGMLPNRFPDRGEQPEYNSVDAALWYIIAVHEYLKAVGRSQASASTLLRDQYKLRTAVEAILNGFNEGTRYRIRRDSDGLLAAGEPGVQLTWMDAKVGDHVITPRIGKPVEIQALWINALWVAKQFGDKQAAVWQALYGKAHESFLNRFWNEERGILFDVIDCDHEAGKMDASFRPNQILAIGGLPLNLLEGGRDRKVLEAVEKALLTPIGLRSLAPGEPHYSGHYEGGPAQRDSCYHQGTVWPWLLGPFVEAWVRVHGDSAEAKQKTRARFFRPIVDHLAQAGLRHVSEIADADAPFTPRGCPFQAWSVGEALRIDREILNS